MIFTRRQALQITAAGGMGALVGGCPQNPGTDGGTDALDAMDAAMDTPSLDTNPTDAGPGDGGTVMTRVVIIGSGFGGAVAALRLAQAGIDSVVLERGKRWPIMPGSWNTFCQTILPDRRSTWMSDTTVLPFGPRRDISKYAGVIERVQGNGMNLYAGAGVGGGSLVYGGVLATPREFAFTRVFPSTIPYAEMLPYFTRARTAMNASPMPADVLANPAFQSETVWRAHASAIGLENTAFDVGANWDVIRMEAAGTVPRSALNGEAIYGNNNGCKISLDVTYLKMAEDSGHCTIHPLHVVRDITRASSGKYVVMVDEINVTGDVIATKSFVCDYLFLAAGTYGTSNLLLKAKNKGLLPDLDSHVGQNFGNNGGAMFAHWGLSENTGMTQAGFVGNAMIDFGNTVAPMVAEHAQLPTGTESHVLLHVCLSLASGIGTYRYDSATDAAVLDWPAGASDTSIAAAQNLADRLIAAVGGTLNGSALGGVVTINGVLAGYTYHPLGGMTIGEATDLYGRVNNYQKLYVIDGSLLPRMAGGVNPALTIMALAERNIERIIRDDFA